MSQERTPFSQRVGARAVAQLGMEDMPPELRVSLWNIIQPWIWSVRQGEYARRAQWVYNFPAIRWPTDEIPFHSRSDHATQRLKEWFFSAEWHAIYDLVEALPEMIAYGIEMPLFDVMRKYRVLEASDRCRQLIIDYATNLDAMLEREGAPYRYRNLQLVPITNEQELSEIDEARVAPFAGARMHIQGAIEKISHRPSPDYRNCVKEAVSAVESLLQEATGLKGEKLPKLLDAFERKYSVDLHRAFKAALGSLYGWTSDDGGIRHGIFGAETVSRDEAQFMLIACSALVNFLVAKARN